MSGVPHNHREHVEGCFRCELSRDELGARQRWCEARVSEPPHYFHHHRCTKRSKDQPIRIITPEQDSFIYLCAQHKRIFEQRGLYLFDGSFAANGMLPP